MAGKKSSKFSELRIIGGKWRSRKIIFPVIEGVRPTPNKVRETLFNWLAPYITDAQCIDLFAGSGALSFEALSRGAVHCVSIDSSPGVIHALKENKEKLHCDNMEIILNRFPFDPSTLSLSFDIVFIDPPFHQGLALLALDWLRNCNCLNPHARVYVETELEFEMEAIQNEWQILKSNSAGNVRYFLLQQSNLLTK